MQEKAKAQLIVYLLTSILTHYCDKFAFLNRMGFKSVMPKTHITLFSQQGVDIPMIIGEIRRYLRDNNSVRVSRSLRDIAYKALCVRERLINTTNREPTIEEIAKEIDIPPEDVTTALDAIQEPISLFEPVYHDGGDAVYVMDQVSDKKNIDEAWIEKISLREAMKKLSDREKQIVTMRFFRGKTQTEVATEVGISQAQVSRLEKSAISNMRKYI